MIHGVITTIQRMSIHDGEGIRSTIFLKGCNMRCGWCHNPETWSRNVILQQIIGRCIGCRSCHNSCINGAVSIVDGRVQINRSKCSACGSCTESCPSGALSMIGESISPKEAFRRIEKDIPFFRQTNGGVTVSGGEPLLQSQFLKEFFTLCRNAGIHTAVETNLSSSWECISGLLDDIDLWMCDLKIADTALHKAMTGIDNTHIIANLMALAATRANIVVRTPIIPNVNDSREAIAAICELLHPLAPAIKGYELLRFHTLGFDKFTACGVDNPLLETAELDMDRFESLRAYAKTILSITR